LKIDKSTIRDNAAYKQFTFETDIT
jgi:hypothetical protein